MIVSCGLIVMDNGFVAVAPTPSVTLALNGNVPDTVGVPEMIPPRSTVRPSGRLPDAIDHVHGSSPPVALSATA